MSSSIEQSDEARGEGNPSYRELTHMAQDDFPADRLWRAPADQIIYAGYQMIDDRMKLRAELVRLESNIARFWQSMKNNNSLNLTPKQKESLNQLKIYHINYSRKLTEDDNRADYLFKSLQVAPDFRAPETVDAPGPHIAEILEYFFRLQLANQHRISDTDFFTPFGVPLSIHQQKVIELQIRELFTNTASELRDISNITNEFNSSTETRVIQNDDNAQELIARLNAIATPSAESSDSDSDYEGDVDTNGEDDEEDTEEET